MTQPAPASPTRRQYRLAREITRWYLTRYHDTADDVGVAAMFCDPARVGHFAVERAAIAAGDPGALFRVLVTTTMFQRRSDAQIMRVLRGISEEDARELTEVASLLQLADTSRCDLLRSNHALLTECDLGKDPVTKLGRCGRHPRRRCHLKRHTSLLKRYGHFGKVPTSAALMVRETGLADLAALRLRILGSGRSPRERAVALQGEISRAWRVSEKISAMFLSAVCNPDLSPGLAPWSGGIDWSFFVVVDSNVDLFLRDSGYPGPWTYTARRSFIERLARRVDPSTTKPSLHKFNPRIVQQAIYLFMSVSNRRATTHDCMHAAPDSCATCPSALRGACAAG